MGVWLQITQSRQDVVWIHWTNKYIENTAVYIVLFTDPAETFLHQKKCLKEEKLPQCPKPQEHSRKNSASTKLKRAPHINILSGTEEE